MQYPDEVVAGWFYLSNLPVGEESERVFATLQSKISSVPPAYQSFYSWYVDYYKNYEQFPSWDSFRATSQMENDCTLSVKEAERLYTKNFAVWESDVLCERMKSVPLTDKRTVLEQMAKLLQAEVTESKPVVSATDFAVDGTMILTDQQEISKFRFPIKHLNESTKIKPGNAIFILAPPAMGKTSSALNITYVNSVVGELRGLYIYLENLPQAYMADILARYSFDNGAKIENSSLKQGVSPDDEAAIKVIRKLKKDFDEAKKGEIFFKPFSDYNTDPIRFGSQLAEDVNRLKIDYIIFDYIQRAKVFAPLRIDAMTYLNQLTSTCSQVALGGFGADHPSIFIGLCQPNRDAQNKAERTHGNSLNRTSVAEVSAVERDAFVMIAFYADAEAKAAGQIGYKICKNRDGPEDVAILTTSYIPQYCYIGDTMEGTDANVFNSSVLDEVFDIDL